MFALWRLVSRAHLNVVDSTFRSSAMPPHFTRRQRHVPQTTKSAAQRNTKWQDRVARAYNCKSDAADHKAPVNPRDHPSRRRTCGATMASFVTRIWLGAITQVQSGIVSDLPMAVFVSGSAARCRPSCAVSLDRASRPATAHVY